MNTKAILSHSWNRMLILELLFLVLVMQVFFTPIPPQKVIAIPKTNDRNPEVTADWGDVVDVNYSLWEDEQHTIEKENNIDVDLVYIYLRRNINVLVPTKVYNAFPPEAKDYLDQLYFQDFINAIIGMKVDQEKNFMIPAENVDSDTDLYFRVRLLVILYDASALTTATATTKIDTSTFTTSLTPTTSNIKNKDSIPELTSLPNSFFTVLFLLMGTLIIIKNKEKGRKENHS